MVTIWDNMNVEEVPTVIPKCKVTRESRAGPHKCGQKADYKLDGNYICSRCLIVRLMLRIQNMQDGHKGSSDNQQN